MARQGQSTHLVSQNNHICLWHYRLTYVSKAQVVRTSRLIDGIDLDNKNKKYNRTKVLIKLDESDMSDLSDSKEPPDSLTPAHTTTALVCRTKIEDTLNKLWQSYVRSKSTRVM